MGERASHSVERTAAFVDGPLFVDGTRGLGLAMDLDLPALLAELAGSAELVAVYYVASISSPQVYPERSRNDESLVERLAEQGIRVRRCPVTVAGHVTVQKGMEAELATALLRGAALDEYDIALLLSNRPELAPPVEVVRQLGKKVSLRFYEYQARPGNPLSDKVDDYAALELDQVVRHSASGRRPMYAY